MGGDDCISILRSGERQVRCKGILERFGKVAPRFYDRKARQEGRIAAKGRRGQDVLYGLLSLSIVGFPPIPPGSTPITKWIPWPRR